MESAKTVFLLTLITVLFVFLGNLFGGTTGMIIALALAGGMNFYAYYNSDKMVLKHYRAVEVGPHEAPGLHAMVKRLSERANIPMPRIYIIPDRTPNAFATGRNPQNAAVAATEGLLDMLSDEEVEGVIAHELCHVRHYDILIGTIAATMAGAITMIANIMQFSAIFGGSSNEEGGGNPIVMFLLAMILPFAAMIIQMTVSRSREYMADEGAARLTGHPEWLQNALSKLDAMNRRGHVQEASPASAHMFIINPFSGKKANFASLFSTHPSTEDRIARLEEVRRQMGI